MMCDHKPHHRTMKTWIIRTDEWKWTFFCAHTVTIQQWVHEVLNCVCERVETLSKRTYFSCLNNRSRLLHLSKVCGKKCTFFRVLNRSYSNKRLKWFNKVQQLPIGRCKCFRSLCEAGIVSKEFPPTPFWLSSFFLRSKILQRKRIAISMNQNILAENLIKTLAKLEFKNRSFFIDWINFWYQLGIGKPKFVWNKTKIYGNCWWNWNLKSK